MTSTARLAAVLLLAASGCSIDTQSSVVINGFYRLVYEADTNDCTHAEEESGLTRGTYDAGRGQFGRSFYEWILVENNLPDNSDESAGRLNSNDFTVEEVVVSIDNRGPWSFLPSKQRIPLSGRVATNGGKTFISVPLISPTLAGVMVKGTPEALSPIAAEGTSFAIMLRVTVRGKLHDGSEIETNEMLFSVNIYNKLYSGPVCDDPQVLQGCTLQSTANGDFPVQPDGWTCVKP